MVLPRIGGSTLKVLITTLVRPKCGHSTPNASAAAASPRAGRGAQDYGREAFRKRLRKEWCGRSGANIGFLAAS